jgi:hypothetical protein
MPPSVTPTDAPELGQKPDREPDGGREADLRDAPTTVPCLSRSIVAQRFQPGRTH